MLLSRIVGASNGTRSLAPSCPWRSRPTASRADIGSAALASRRRADHRSGERQRYCNRARGSAASGWRTCIVNEGICGRESATTPTPPLTTNVRFRSMHRRTAAAVIRIPAWRRRIFNWATTRKSGRRCGGRKTEDAGLRRRFSNGLKRPRDPPARGSALPGNSEAGRWP